MSSFLSLGVPENLAAVLAADGLFVPGVGNFHACVQRLTAVRGPLLIGRRLAGGRPVLGVCVGMQVLFEGSEEPGASRAEGLGEWPGVVQRLEAEVVPHMGWSRVSAAPGSRLFAGVEQERFYFVHSYAAPVGPRTIAATEHGAPWSAVVRSGLRWGAQFHPERSASVGARLLRNFLTEVDR